MVRKILTIWALAFLGGIFTGQSVFAQATEEPQWVSKPVQCGSPKTVFTNIQSQGMKTFFGGMGLSNSVNYEQPLSVFVFLAINLETQEWAAVEVNNEKTDACIIGFGAGTVFDPEQLQEFTRPEYFQ